MCMYPTIALRYCRVAELAAQLWVGAALLSPAQRHVCAGGEGDRWFARLFEVEHVMPVDERADADEPIAPKQSCVCGIAPRAA